ncbi:hypothetical protein FMM82_35340, partial [[Clostridium] clostridioforme]|nr:hypothetical protein [Enterocloster clostridioformis]NDO32855.1 hypothetical protein [Enterocloster clostridioformis]
YQELLDTCYGKDWVTDIRESFAGAETVMHYLGRYTHRIAVSNSRILRMDETTVTPDRLPGVPEAVQEG